MLSFKSFTWFCLLLLLTVQLSSVPVCKSKSVKTRSMSLLNLPESKYFESSTVGCDANSLKKADKTMKKLVSIGSNGRKFPTSFRKLPKYCSESESLINELSLFINKCYKPEIRDMVKILIFSVKNMIKQFCKKRSKKLSELLIVAKCVNEEITNDRCMHNFINKTSTFQYLSDDKKKLPYTCCEYNAALNCVENMIESIPCAAKNIQVTMDFVKGLFGNIANFACGEYSESTTRCEELGPPKVPLSLTKPKKYETFMFVLIDLLESMESFNLL